MEQRVPEPRAVVEIAGQFVQQEAPAVFDEAMLSIVAAETRAA